MDCSLFTVLQKNSVSGGFPAAKTKGAAVIGDSPTTKTTL